MYTQSNPHTKEGSRRRSSGGDYQRRKQYGRPKSGGFSRVPHGSGHRSSSRKVPSFNPLNFINTHPVETVAEIYEPKHSFATFGLSDALVQAIAGAGMAHPSPIQDQIIPHVLAGRDVIGLAETGTGKTAAFLIPLIEKTHKDPSRQTLILAPTRELTIQIQSELQKLSRNRLYSVVCVGGTSIHPQIQALRKRNHFIIGTPGRVLDLIRRKDFKTGQISTVVLDEADRMLDMGFINDMRSILGAIPKERETLLFSATMSDATNKIVNDFLRDPVSISVKKKDVTNSIAQDVVRYKYEHKFETLTSLLAKPECKKVIVFGAMKHSVEKLAKQLAANGIAAESIHGNKSHNQRQRSLQAFKNGRARVLVATDVAARGIHVDDVSHVINYDLPNTFEDYVHRIGRTGRADKRGIALTFIPA